MSGYSRDHAAAFIRLLTGDEKTVVHFQMFYDVKDGSQRKDLATEFAATLNQAEPKILRAEHNLQGVYICINETDRRGRDLTNITKVRALFADFDNQIEPVWPLLPHFVTKRDDTHGHAYWLVDDVEVDEFMYLQRQIAQYCDTDTQVIDPARVVRLPGTLHLKNPLSPKRYHVATVNNISEKYKKQAILDAFELSGEKKAIYEEWVASRTANTIGSGFSDNEVYINKYKRFLIENAEPAVEGSGSATLIRVTGYAYDHGITLPTAQQLTWEYYNPKCVPPWTESERHEFDAIIERSYKYARNEPGCKTAQAVFIQAPELPPAPKRKVIDIIRQGDRYSREIGETNWPMATAKSPHYELAQIFDGMVFNGTDLVRCNKIFYEYGGRSWSIVSDEVIKARIQRYLAKFKPSDSLVRGVFNSLCDLVNVSKVENGIWLDTGKPCDNVVCFRNSLVDLSDNKAVLIDHSPNFFCFNELDYDYKPAETCPQWLAFLNDVFEHDPKLILQLQEWFGYCMTSDNRMHKFAVFIGKSRAGKGVISEMLRLVVGVDNTAAPSLSKLTNDSALHDMSVASVAFIPDAHSVHASKRDDVISNFKAITGGDPIGYHVIYKGTENKVFKTRFVLSTNNMPEFIDPSGALVNRMLVFPFHKSFAGREDYKLKDKLAVEVAGVAQWALEGLRRLRANGRFTEAESGVNQKEMIKHDMNPLAGFVDTVCVVSPDAFVSNDRLYDTYLLWCKQRKILSPMSPQKLTRILNASDLPIKQERKRVDGARQYGFEGINVVQFPAIK